MNVLMYLLGGLARTGGEAGWRAIRAPWSLFVLTASASAGDLIPYSIAEMSLTEASDPKGIMARVVATVQNSYPIKLALPALTWVIEAAACTPAERFRLATAQSAPVTIEPKGDVDLQVTSVVSDVPAPFTRPCPGSETGSSAIDRYLAAYLSGETVTLYVHGHPSQLIPDFPEWVTDLLASVSVPVPVAGRNTSEGRMGDMVKSFGFTRVKMTVPARGEGPGALPRLSALVNADIELPAELDFKVSVDRLKGDSDLSYAGKKFGRLELHDWIPAISYYTPEGYIHVVAELDNVPMEIDDQAVFKRLVQKLVFSGAAEIDLVGLIDVGIDTPVGEFIVHRLPVEGEVPLRGRPSSVPGLPAGGFQPPFGGEPSIGPNEAEDAGEDAGAEVAVAAAQVLAEAGDLLTDSAVVATEALDGLMQALEQAVEAALAETLASVAAQN
ncbi:uncharacterized protein V1510DRAFT_106005 [Dipodascopsis tothii]|uniref:uncharacterized protein n=1 Tax=Dipodascopsis tothii TaxID=44089 RepID=UPI0034CFFA61